MIDALVISKMDKNNKHNIKDKKMKLLASILKVVEGDLYNITGEDELLYVYDCFVEAIVDGDIYHHNHVFYGHVQDDDGYEHPNRNAKNDAEDLVNRIHNSGCMIDTTHWRCVGNLSEQEDPLVRLEREWNTPDDCYENYNMGV